MATYIVVPLVKSSEALDRAIEARVATENRHKLQGDHGWLVAYEGTTIELCNFIGLTGQAKGEKAPLGSAIAVPVTGYFGRGPTDMWEWLKTRLEQ